MELRGTGGTPLERIRRERRKLVHRRSAPGTARRRGILRQVVLLLAFALAWSGATAQAGTKPGITFGTGGGLALLRELLNTIAPRKRLERLAGPMVLWGIGVDRVATNAPGDCIDPETGRRLEDERLQLVFLFGSHSRRSQRAYRVAYAACQSPAGTFDFTSEGERFSAESGLDDAAVLTDVNALQVLRHALNDENVFEELRHLEESSRLSYLRLIKSGINDDGVAEYELVAADAPRAQWSEQTRSIAFHCFLDLAQGSATFHRRLD